jgi:hypothetical protein
MAGLASAAAVVLAVVLAVAAAGKVVHHRRTVAGFDHLGLPAPAVAAWAVPAVEALVAVVLLAAPGWGGVAAFALLAGFTAYLAAVVASGRRVACGCFGSSGSRPVSGRDLVRNGLLLAAAGLAATRDGPLVLEPAALGAAAAATAVAAAVLRRWPGGRESPVSQGPGMMGEVDEGGPTWPSW